jgi:hypothetical protein
MIGLKFKTLDEIKTLTEFHNNYLYYNYDDINEFTQHYGIINDKYYTNVITKNNMKVSTYHFYNNEKLLNLIGFNNFD